MINGQIRDKEVRVIGENGEQLGIMSSREAMKLAQEAELDLVKIAPKAQPPVCKIIVHLGRLRDKSRKLLEVSEVLGYEDGKICLQLLYKYEEEGEKKGKVTGNWRKIHEITNDQKLKMAGYDQEGTCDDHN